MESTFPSKVSQRGRNDNESHWDYMNVRNDDFPEYDIQACMYNGLPIMNEWMNGALSLHYTSSHILGDGDLHPRLHRVVGSTVIWLVNKSVRLHFLSHVSFRQVNSWRCENWHFHIWRHHCWHFLNGTRHLTVDFFHLLMYCLKLEMLWQFL